MFSCRLVVVLRTVLVTLAAIGYTNGEEVKHIDCVEHPASTDRTKICVDPPIDYDLHMPDMKQLIDSNKISNLFATEQSDGFEDYEPRAVGDDQNCRAITTWYTPYVLKKNDSSIFTSYYVPQIDYFVQKVKVTKCLKLGAPCFGNVFQGTTTISTSCKEKTAFTSIYVYNHRLKNITLEPFEFPICCTCIIQ